MKSPNIPGGNSRFLSNRQTSVLYIGPPWSDYGSPHYAMAALYLIRRGVTVCYLAWGSGRPKTEMLESGNLTYSTVTGDRNYRSATKYLFEILSVLRTSKFSICYVQGAPLAPFAFFASLMFPKITFVYHTQDYLEPGQFRFYRFFERLMARRAHVVICNERNRARCIASDYRLTTIPWVVRTALPSWWPQPNSRAQIRDQLLKNRALVSSESVCLVAAGGPYIADRMSPQVIDALSLLPERYMIVFTAMPQGSPGAISLDEHLKRRPELKGRVIIENPTDFDSLLQLYQACDIGLLLYPDNGIGHFYQAPGRLTEYLRAGLVLVASNFPPFEVLFLRFNLGSLVTPESPQSIAAGILSSGELSTEEKSNRREKLVALASNELAYEHDAEGVFGKLLDRSLRNSERLPIGAQLA